MAPQGMLTGLTRCQRVQPPELLLLAEMGHPRRWKKAPKQVQALGLALMQRLYANRASEGSFVQRQRKDLQLPKGFHAKAGETTARPVKSIVQRMMTGFKVLPATTSRFDFFRPSPFFPLQPSVKHISSECESAIVSYLAHCGPSCAHSMTFDFSKNTEQLESYLADKSYISG